MFNSNTFVKKKRLNESEGTHTSLVTLAQLETP